MGSRNPKRPKKRRQKKKADSRPKSVADVAPVPNKRLRNRLLTILGILGAVLGVYAFDRSGPLETIPGQVVETRTYPHTPRGAPTHIDTDAVIEFEGRQHTLKETTNMSRDQWVEIRIRRGRLSGQAYYSSLIGNAGVELIPGDSTTPQPWQYDVVRDRHWDPGHNHWHDGPPPQR